MNTKIDDRKLLGSISEGISVDAKKLKVKDQEKLELKLKSPTSRITVENQSKQKLDDLSIVLSNCLYPLLKQKHIEVNAHAKVLKSVSPQECEVVFEVFALDDTFLHPQNPQSPLEMFHSIVAGLFESATKLNNSSHLFQIHRQILEMMEEQKICRNDLLPESELLMRLIYSKAIICHGNEIQSVYNNACKKLEVLTFGQPLKFGEIELYPVYRDDQMKNVISISDLPNDKRNIALVNGLAIFNSTEKSLVVLEDESVFCHGNHMINRTVVIPPESRFTFDVLDQVDSMHQSSVLSMVTQRSQKWNYDSADFTPTNYEESRHQTSSAEVFTANKIEADTRSLHSPSYGALKSEYKRIGQMLQDCANNATYPKNACGYMVFRNGCFSMMEVYPNSQFLKNRWEIVLDAVVTDAAFSPMPPKKSKPDTPNVILDEMKKSVEADCISKSSGDCFRVRANNIIGGGNIYDAQLCHFVAVANDSVDMDE